MAVSGPIDKLSGQKIKDLVAEACTPGGGKKVLNLQVYLLQHASEIAEILLAAETHENQKKLMLTYMQRIQESLQPVSQGVATAIAYLESRL